MRYGAKIDWWIAVALLAGIGAPLLGRAYWVSGLVLLVYLAFLLPQSYETTPEGLLIRAGLYRKLIPYASINAIGPCKDQRTSFALSMDRLTIGYGEGKEVRIAPADQEGFMADLAMRTPQLR
ncbi:MAG: PH domain-containing protein [Bryobacteraceae bacterium]